MNCHCGRPLHYSDPEIQKLVEKIIAEKGEFVPIKVLGGRAWKVPRHFIALHGIRAWEIPTLGFEEIG